MAFQSFEDLEVWQRGCRLAVDVFKTFTKCRNFTMQDQVQRAALSVPSNVAEGYERNSNKEFIRFLNIAKGSCGEVRSQLYVALDAGYLDQLSFDAILGKVEEVGRVIGGLRASVEAIRDKES